MYTEILNNLNSYSAEAQAVITDLNKTLDSYQHQFTGEYFEEQATTVTEQAKTKLDTIIKNAQQNLDNGLQLKQKQLDSRYFADITPEVSSELEMLSHSKLSEDELEGYLRKFANNYPAMRRLESIAKEDGYKIIGITYNYEIQFMKSFKGNAQSMITAMDKPQQTTAKIAKRLIEQRVDEYNTKMEQESYKLIKWNN